MELRNRYERIRVDDANVSVEIAGGLTAQLRKRTSDFEVFNQVVVRNEYRPVIDLLVQNNIKVETIVDGGSNIGLTSLLLSMNFPSAFIICVEPDATNFKQLTLNRETNSLKWVLVNKALWSKIEKVYISNDFRDGEEWSRKVDKSPGLSDPVAIEGITIQQLIDDHHLAVIDFLKLDIEGSEAEIFKETNDLTFLQKIKVIAIEIHDEFNCRDRIYSILRNNNFLLSFSGELTIGVNRNFYLDKTNL